MALPRRRFALTCLGLALLAAAGAEGVIATAGDRVTVLSRRNDPAEEAEQRRLRDASDDVAEIYGTPVGREAIEVVGVPNERLLVPAEDPHRRLLVVAPGAPPPLQARTVRFVARAAAAALAVVGLLSLAWPRRHRAPSPLRVA